jgi:CRISPR-associated endonuclease Cas1
MNSLWLERITSYKNSPLATESAQIIIEQKVSHQNALLKKYQQVTFTVDTRGNSINDLLLYEARAAKHFWKQYKILIPLWAQFPGRRARGKDVTNTLLDIGYHHLANEERKILEKHNVTLAPALFHVAHKEKSAPLVYDLMELFRSDIVDTEVLKYLRQKRRSILTIEQSDIRIFLHRINKRLEKRHFLQDFHQCHTYRYYMELQLIKFIKAVNHKEVFAPLHLPQRHDTRCACTHSQPMV